MHKTRLLRGLAVASALLVGLAGLANVARADKVGVAAAVNPDAFSTLAGAPQTQLNIGKSIFFNERINSTGSGLVQVLLVDGSTFTVGPGSDLVIDKIRLQSQQGNRRDCRHQHHDGLLQQSFCVRGHPSRAEPQPTIQPRLRREWSLRLYRRQKPSRRLKG